MSLTRRQTGSLAAITTLGVVTVTAALLDQLAVAVAALGAAAVFLFLAVLQTHRRVTEVLAAVAGRQGGGRDQESVSESSTQLQKYVVRRLHDQTREVEALLQLFRGVEPRAPMPPSGKTALKPTGLLQLCALVETLQPKLVLELGSGTSSVWLGYLLERYHGRLITVDHNPAFAAETRVRLQRHGLANIAEVRDAPLKPVTVNGRSYQWYDPAAFADLAGIDLLVVDGPPANSGPHARYPAFPVLEGQLSSHAGVVLDDVSRQDEQDIVRQWTESTAGLEQELGTVGNVAVLTYARTR